jgi:hypothetical protein
MDYRKCGALHQRQKELQQSLPKDTPKKGYIDSTAQHWLKAWLTF